MSQDTVVTRFAPSPTGFLHIGGARTALFNWLFAHANAGRFLLRIEDTDRARSTPEAVQAIIDGLTWLGLDWDGEPYFQARHADRHAELANALLESGLAYRCYMDAEETAAEREKAHAAGTGLRSPWRERDGAGDGEAVVRFKAPLEGETVLADRVQGEVRFPNKSFDDLVLLRADGTPTYNLAVVADDHDMGVTHVIRGDDHLVNAARQSHIYEALCWDAPVFAHIPLIHGSDGGKLSKRHGALGAESYRNMGMLPEGLRNYLLRLGWAHGDQEIFTDAEAIAAFSLEAVNKAAPKLDLEKMASINAHHLRAADDERLLHLVCDRIQADTGAPPGPDQRAMLSRGMPALKTRAKTVNELADQAGFILATRPLEISGKAAKPLTKDGAADILTRFRDRFSEMEWRIDTLETGLERFAADLNVGFGKIGAPLRAVLTAGAPAPDMAHTLHILGKDEALGRISDWLDKT